jgi:hypothetical protein
MALHGIAHQLRQFDHAWLAALTDILRFLRHRSCRIGMRGG